jgi:hypothetical protein
MKIEPSILRVVRDKFIKTTIENVYSHFGLCLIVSELHNCGKLSDSQMGDFHTYLEFTTSNKGLYWEMVDGELDKSTDYTFWTWVWKPKNKKVRLNWLDKHIKLNS